MSAAQLSITFFLQMAVIVATCRLVGWLAQRYFGHSAAHLSRMEAARIAAALPAPKKREVIDPGGFTRRHGNAIARQTGVVQSSDYDVCVYD